MLDMNWDTEETTLFLKLNHSAAQVRAAAVASVVAAVLDGRIRSTALAVSTVVERLLDSSPAVVLEVLRLQDLGIGVALGRPLSGRKTTSASVTQSACLT